jgi:phage baseplate assembly protein W
MASKQYFGIKYPFLNDGSQHFFLDVNENIRDKVKSQLIHIVFTPKGQRIRNPEFGTDLIKFLFSPSDDMTWEAVKTEVSESVTRWSNNMSIRNIEVVKNEEDEHEVYVRLDYSVTEGNKVTNDSVVVEL